MDLLYYPGCTLKTSAKNMEASAMAITEALGHKLVEMEDWTCCGVVASLTSDDLMHHLAPLRNLVHVEDQGLDKVLVLCDMCYNTLRQTDYRVKNDQADLDTLNDFMDQENDYQKTVTVMHFLEFLRDEVGFDTLKKQVKKPLKGLKLMPYYGCMMLRPREVAIDDSEDPRILSDLIRALGGEVIENPFNIECCGSYRTINEKEMTSKRAKNISTNAIKHGVDAIFLSCPLCKFNLDTRGKEAETMYDGYVQPPVFYFTQLIALALGLDADSLGFDTHAVDPTPLLRKRGVIE